MMKVIVSFDDRLIEHYQETRRVDIFTKIINGIKPEYFTLVDKTRTQIEFNFGIEAKSSEITKFILSDILELNEKEFPLANVTAIQYVPEEKMETIKNSEEIRLENSKKFVNYIEEIDDLREFLEEKLLGQDHVIDSIVTGLLKVYLSSSKEANAPAATFTFVGPRCVGKSYACELTAKYMKEHFDIPSLIVDQSNYENADFLKNILRFVDDNPKAILVFNDVEQIDSAYALFFKTIFTTGEFNKVDFRKTFMFFTSSLGRTIYEKSIRNDGKRITKEDIVRALFREQDPKSVIRGFVDPVITACLEKGEMIMFNHLELPVLKAILVDHIQKRFNNFYQTTNIQVNANVDALADIVFFSNDKAYNIDNIIKRFDQLFDNELNELFIQKHEGSPLLSYLNTLNFKFDLDSAHPAVHHLFAQRDLKCLIITEDESLMALKDMEIPHVKVYVSNMGKSIRALLNEGIDFVLLDPITEPANTDTAVMNIDDIDSFGMDMFNMINNFYAGTPIYLLSNKEFLSYDAFKTLLDKGAKDVIEYEMGNVEFIASGISFIQVTMELGKDVNDLIATSQVLTYNSKQILSDNKNGEMDIVFSKLNLSFARHSVSNKALLNNVPQVRFGHVCGNDRVKQVLAKYLEYLKNPKSYLDKYMEAPNGILLYGPAGMGKKMLACALAGEARSVLVELDLVQIYCEGHGDAGEISRLMHNAFKSARACPSAVILMRNCETFFDFSSPYVGSPSYMILSSLRAEIALTKRDVKNPVLVVATCNSYTQEYIMDDFQMTFDKATRLSTPNQEERYMFVKAILKMNSIDTLSEETIQNFVRRTAYQPYAAIRQLLEYIIKCARGKELTNELFVDAYDQYSFGDKTSVNKKVQEETAYHEVGHLILSILLNQNPTFVTIVSRDSGFLGYTMPGYDEESGGMTKDNFLDSICMAFGGRAAETIIYGDKGINTGIGSDIQQANRSARLLVCRYGMGKNYGVYNPSMDLSQYPQVVIDEINQVLNEQYARAVKLLTENRSKLEAITKALIEKNSLIDAEFMKIFREN